MEETQSNEAVPIEESPSNEPPSYQRDAFNSIHYYGRVRAKE